MMSWMQLLLSLSVLFNQVLSHNAGNTYNSTAFLSHGPLKDQWLPMKQSEALSFYTAHEICLLINPGGDCRKEPGNIGECNANSQDSYKWFGTCASPSGFFLRHFSTFQWPRSQTIVDLINTMKRRGSNTIFFIGDSMSRQHWYEAYCSLSRFSFSLVKSSQFDGRNDGITYGFEVLSPHSRESSTPPYFQVLYISQRKMSAFHDIQRTILKFLGDSSLVQGRSLFIVNTGLVFRSEPQEKYARILREYLPFFLQLSKEQQHTVFFRETSAQHFHTPTGAYSQSIVLGAKAVSRLADGPNQVSFVSTIGHRSGLIPTSGVWGPSAVGEWGPEGGTSPLTIGAEGVLTASSIHKPVGMILF